MSKSLNDRIRFWLDSDTSLLNVMIIEEAKDHNSCVITPPTLAQSEGENEEVASNCINMPRMLRKPEEVLNFMFPYIYELAYAEANGTPKNEQLYKEAVSFKNKVNAFLRNQVSWGYINQTEARIVLVGLCLPTNSFPSP